MSVLHSRILANGGQGRDLAAAQEMKPYGTAATPMLLPSAVLVEYADSVGTYQDLYPSPPATGDWNAAPVSSFRQPVGVRPQPYEGPAGYDVRRTQFVSPPGYVTSDANAVPVAMISNGGFGTVVPAGRP